MDRFRVLFLADNAVRITLAPDRPSIFPPDPPWFSQVFLPQPEVKNPTLQVDTSSGHVQVKNIQGEIIFAKAHPCRIEAGGKIILSLETTPGEGFYGWGEWFHAFRREQGTLHLHNAESPSMMQGRQTYSTIPFFLSSRGYGFFLLNSRDSTWHIDKGHRILHISVEGTTADYIIIYGPDYKTILRTYTALTGRPPLLPLWAFGLWVTSYPQGHQDGVVEHVREHRRRQLPLDAVILDYHWEDRFHNFQWRRELIPEPQRLITELRELGMRLGLIFTPFLNTRNLVLQKIALWLMSRDIPDGMITRDERALPEFEQARREGYLAHENAFWWFGRGGMIDFSNPQAARWWNEHLRPLYQQGVDFFKNDDGEYLPADAHSTLGMDGGEYHNLYGFFYGRALHQGMAELDDRRPLVYARSVWAGSQRYPALFLGDQRPTFECLRRTMRAGLNMSLLGFSYWTADVFGLDGKTTPETHMRYAQWALLVPVARYFWRPPQIDNTRFPWSHGEKVEANFRTYSELRYRLLPHYYSLAWEAASTGLPIMRPMLLEYPDDPRLAGVYDQVLLGGNLMLAPVVQKGATERQIILPQGAWHDFWSTRTWQGAGEISYPAPLERLPILVRGSSVLLMGAAVSHIADDHRFDPLQVHLYPPYPAEGTLYEDDGHTRAWERGEFALTRISAREDGSSLQVIISAAQGHFSGQSDRRQVEIICHRSLPPEAVFVDDQHTSRWHYDPEKQQLIISAESLRKQELTVKINPSSSSDV